MQNLRVQARLAEAAGFDGCMTSEHHGGFSNYLPNALVGATWALDATDRIWAAPCPLVLPLRPLSQTVEDLAWTHHRYPGRVGVGVCAGALPVDFELAGVPFAEAFPRYRAALPKLVDALMGRATGPLGAEPAVAALPPGAVPVVAAVQAPVSAARAGALGIGVLYDSLQTIARTAELSAAHQEGLASQGGHGGPVGGPGGFSAARILIRRVWIGPPPTEAVATQMARYEGYAPDRARAHWAGDALIAGADGREVAEQLRRAMVDGDCDAVNLRVFLAGLSPAQVAEQIVRHGEETLPRLRELIDQPRNDQPPRAGAGR